MLECTEIIFKAEANAVADGSKHLTPRCTDSGIMHSCAMFQNPYNVELNVIANVNVDIDTDIAMYIDIFKYLYSVSSFNSSTGP